MGSPERDVLGPEFPRVLRRVWRLCDPASQCRRRSNALDRLTDHRRFRAEGGDYWICAETGQLEREGPWRRAEESAEVYDAWWKSHIAEGPPSGRDTEKRRRLIAGLEGYRRTGRLLEVGSGRGKILRAAMEAGWRAEGNDLSAVAARAAEELSGARVMAGPIGVQVLDPGAYDVVLLNDVFEHLEDPRSALIKLSAALRPGGALFLQTLNAQSLSLRLHPVPWGHFADGHLIVPTLVSLRHYFQAARLRVARLETHGFSSRASGPRGGRGFLLRVADKTIAAACGRLDLGHRVKALLEAEERRG